MLTPFRQVARHRDLAAHRRRYPGITIGTVHTAQNREADIAVSRARRRLYVIGDRRSWAEQPHFEVLASHLATT